MDKRVAAASAEGGSVQQAGESHALFVLRCQNQDSTATLLALVADVIPSTFLWCVPQSTRLLRWLKSVSASGVCSIRSWCHLKFDVMLLTLTIVDEWVRAATADSASLRHLCLHAACVGVGQWMLMCIVSQPCRLWQSSAHNQSLIPNIANLSQLKSWCCMTFGFYSLFWA